MTNIIKKYGLIALLTSISIVATYVTYTQDAIITYNDAESHLAIAKRVIHSITPGLAQFGSVWLPLQHILMIPFIWIEPLYRSGLAGSLVSMMSFVWLGVFFFKLLRLQLNSLISVVVGCVVLLLNPNILYFQSVPMNEVLFLAMATTSVYYFIRWWKDMKYSDIILASFFVCLASMTRYEAWFLIGFESFAIVIKLFLKENFKIKHFSKYEGLIFFHGAIAYAGVIAWLLWGWILIGDPLYFQRSEYSAQAQQLEFKGRGELLTYHNLEQTALHMAGATYQNIGNIISILFILALIILFIFFFLKKPKLAQYVSGFLFFSSIAFSLFSLYMGQTIIFVPGITPKDFGNDLFNIRYGLNALLFVSFIIAFAADKLPKILQGALIIVVIFTYGQMLQAGHIITYKDGAGGISSRVSPKSDDWLRANYDDGLIIYDDFNRSMSVLRTNIPMQQAIYVGNQPYWKTTLDHPEKYVTWIVIREKDVLWKNIYSRKVQRRGLELHFEKVYQDEYTTIWKKKSRIN